MLKYIIHGMKYIIWYVTDAHGMMLTRTFSPQWVLFHTEIVSFSFQVVCESRLFFADENTVEMRQQASDKQEVLSLTVKLCVKLIVKHFLF